MLFASQSLAIFQSLLGQRSIPYFWLTSVAVNFVTATAFSVFFFFAFEFFCEIIQYHRFPFTVLVVVVFSICVAEYACVVRSKCVFIRIVVFTLRLYSKRCLENEKKNKFEITDKMPSS